MWPRVATRRACGGKPIYRPGGFGSFPGGGPTEAEGKYTETLRVRIDPELLDAVREKAKSLNTDLSTYVRWCIQTGLFLDDLNAFVRAQGKLP